MKQKIWAGAKQAVRIVLRLVGLHVEVYVAGNRVLQFTIGHRPETLVAMRTGTSTS